MLFLLLAAADPDVDPIEAERAFARAAQAKGQWTAFRAFMTDDAIVFTPEAVKAKESLPEKDPPIAVQWWPAESYVSCDGTAAVNTGPWVRPKASGYFTTVWLKQADGGWKWVLDHGDALTKPRALPETPKVRRAACRGKPFLDGATAPHSDNKSGGGASSDRTLVWHWAIHPNGSRVFSAHLWNGRGYERVVFDVVVAPPK